MNREVISAFKEFLIDKGVIDEFCEAFPKSEFVVYYYNLINSFDWGKARKRQQNNIQWSVIDDEWQDIFDSLGLETNYYNEISDYKSDIVMYLTESKTNRMLKHISRIRDDI